MTYEWVQGRYFRGSLVERKNGIRLIVVPKYMTEQSVEVWNWCCETQGLADTEEAAQKAAERAVDAYRRGAEDMREAAAKILTCHFPGANADGSRCGLCRLCDAAMDEAIRALPIPEDK
jgi:hypothetical protein